MAKRKRQKSAQKSGDQDGNYRGTFLCTLLGTRKRGFCTITLHNIRRRDVGPHLLAECPGNEFDIKEITRRM